MRGGVDHPCLTVAAPNRSSQTGPDGNSLDEERGTMRRSTTVVDGAIGGILAGAVVAAWFFVLDVATGQPFHTPRVLAAALLGHESSLATARFAIVYTGLHLGVFAVLGIAGPKGSGSRVAQCRYSIMAMPPTTFAASTCTGGNNVSTGTPSNSNPP